MDTISLTSTNTASAAVTTGGIKTPEAESETPSRIIQPIKPLTFTNGVLKRRHHTHHLSSPPSPAAVTYRECLKNHAAAMGGHAVDGCGEFMPSPTSTPADPTSLKCAACGCHRNFHRRYPDESVLRTPPSSDVPPHHVIEYKPYHRHHPPPPGVGGDGDGNSSPNSPSPPPISSSYFPSAPHMLLALSSGGLSGHPPENRQTAANPGSRKRFRTKFTADQKRMMREFAEGVGWRFQKRDEEAISEFCKQVGVERGVLKVWMHNNKATFGKSEINNNDIDAGTANGSHNNNGHSVDNAAADHHHHRRENPSHVVAANGCSSSS